MAVDGHQTAEFTSLLIAWLLLILSRNRHSQKIFLLKLAQLLSLAREK